MDPVSIRLVSTVLLYKLSSAQSVILLTAEATTSDCTSGAAVTILSIAVASLVGVIVFLFAVIVALFSRHCGMLSYSNYYVFMMFLR